MTSPTHHRIDVACRMHCDLVMAKEMLGRLPMNSELRILRPHRSDRQAFVAVLAVWGEKFIDLFLKVGLPSILSPNNMPRVGEDFDLEMIIATRRGDVHFFQADPLIRLLQKHVRIKYDCRFDGSLLTGIDHWRPWRQIREEASAQGKHFLSILPDVMYADGAIHELCEAGVESDLVYACIPQVLKEFTLAAIQRELVPEQPATFTRDRLAQLLRDYIHPKQAIMIERPRRQINHPEYYIRANHHEIAIAEFGAQPFCVSAGCRNLTLGFDSYSPQVRVKTIPIVGLGLEDTIKYHELFYCWRREAGERLKPFNMATWARHFRAQALIAHGRLEQRLPSQPQPAKGDTKFDYANSVKVAEDKRYRHHAAILELMQHFLAARDCFAGIVDDEVLTLSHLPVISPRVRKLLLRIGRMTVFVPTHCTASTSAKSIATMEQEFASCIVPGKISMVPSTLFSLIPSNEIKCGLHTSHCRGADGDSWPATGTIVSPAFSPAPDVTLYLYRPADPQHQPILADAIAEPVPAAPLPAVAPPYARPPWRQRLKRDAVRVYDFAYLIPGLRLALKPLRAFYRYARGKPPLPESHVSFLRPALESARRRYRRMMKVPLLNEIHASTPATPPSPLPMPFMPPSSPDPRPLYLGRMDRHIVLLHNINVVQEYRLALEEFSKRIGVTSVPAAVLGAVQKDLEKLLEQSKPEDPESLRYILEMSVRAVSDDDLARLARLKPILADAEKRGLDQLFGSEEGTICALLFDVFGDYCETQRDVESALGCYQRAFALDSRLTYAALKVCRILQNSAEPYQALLWARNGINSSINVWGQVMPTPRVVPAQALLARHLSAFAGLDSEKPSHSTIQPAKAAIG